MHNWVYASEFKSNNYTSESRWYSKVRRRKWLRNQVFTAYGRWIRFTDIDSVCFLSIDFGKVHVITRDGKLFSRKGILHHNPEGFMWELVDAPLLNSISFAAFNDIWALAQNGTCLLYHDSEWTTIDNDMRWFSISAGRQIVWALKIDHSVYFRPGISSDWIEMIGEMRDLVIGPADQVWAIGLYDRHLYWRSGVNQNDRSGRTWVKVACDKLDLRSVGVSECVLDPLELPVTWRPRRNYTFKMPATLKRLLLNRLIARNRKEEPANQSEFVPEECVVNAMHLRKEEIELLHLGSWKRSCSLHLFQHHLEITWDTNNKFSMNYKDIAFMYKEPLSLLVFVKEDGADVRINFMGQQRTRDDVLEELNQKVFSSSTAEGSGDKLWLIDELGNIYTSYSDQGKWFPIKGNLQSIAAACKEVVWGLGNDGCCWIYCENEENEQTNSRIFQYSLIQRFPFGTQFEPVYPLIGNTVENISLPGLNWNWSAITFERNDNRYSKRANIKEKATPWSRLEATFQIRCLSLKMVTADKIAVWVADQNGAVYFREGVTKTNPGGSDWRSIECDRSIVSLSLGGAEPRFVLWAVCEDGSCLIRYGIRLNSLHGNSWDCVPTPDNGVNLVSVHVANNCEVWAIDSNQLLWRKDKVTTFCFDGDGWVKVNKCVKSVCISSTKFYSITSENKKDSKEDVLHYKNGFEGDLLKGRLSHISCISSVDDSG